MLNGALHSDKILLNEFSSLKCVLLSLTKAGGWQVWILL